MSILPQLLENKGTISSRLGKDLAIKVLSGKEEILPEAVKLTAYKTKNVRAGAAKIIEQVALKKPELVVPFLDELAPALEQPEAQTRWMIIHTFGLCAHLAPDKAEKVFPYAKQFMNGDSGACLWGAAIKYLGFFGATGPESAEQAFPLLAAALEDLPKQARQTLTALLHLAPSASPQLKTKIREQIQPQLDSESKSAAREARKILKSLES